MSDSDLAKEILPVNIVDELKRSYLDYAMSVIIGRALPDVRDGLKPVHRRVLYAMRELGNDFNKPYKKSARVVGDVIGKYHPHGDVAVYDTIVRMAQSFSMRYTLIDGQGNFGSIDGDAPAAMRYTEIRMCRITHEVLADLDKETVNYVPNYDNTETIPEVLPAKIPGLLINGSAGIAVGMATNIPPHNLTEIINGCLALIDDADLTIDQLLSYIPGPDFPTAAMINGRAGIIEAYKTGRGRIYIRSKYHIEGEEGKKQQIVIDEIPYQINKARLVEKIAELVKQAKIEGISALRDESDKDGLRVVIEVKRGEDPEVIVNNLFTQTQLESVFGINLVALVDEQPKLLNLKQCLEYFLRHRREVVVRRTLYDLRKARDRGHILEGLAIALANIDAIVALIRASKTSVEAKERLIAKGWAPGSVMPMLDRTVEQNYRPENLDAIYGLRNGLYYLSPQQAQAILDLRLHRLTGLEYDKLVQEYQDILVRIQELLRILQDDGKLMDVIRTELIEIRDMFGDQRRTEIVADRRDVTALDLIPEEDAVVTLSRNGYAKMQLLEDYQAQNRGGRGKLATQIREEDVIDKLLIANTRDTILCFTSFGKVYWLKVFHIPQGSRQSKGRLLVNLLQLEENERVTTILPLPDSRASDARKKQDYEDGRYIFMVTAKGKVKKTPLHQFANPRSNGLIALNLEQDDRLIAAAITDGRSNIMLFSDQGKAVRFHEKDVRAMGRTATGVRGMNLDATGQVIAMIIPEAETEILTATVQGFGKRTRVDDYPVKGRGGKGMIAMQLGERNGAMVAAVAVHAEDDAVLITDKGTLVRIRVADISLISRNTKGVRLINLTKEEKLVEVQTVRAEIFASTSDISDSAATADIVAELE